MSTVTIYGASDDLIEVEGALNEEFPYSSDDRPSYLAFNTGTLLSIRYGDGGIWAIRVLEKGSAEIVERFEASDPNNNYSDRLTLSGDFAWVVAGPSLKRAVATCT